MAEGLVLHNHVTQKIGEYGVILTTVDTQIKKFIISIVSKKRAIIMRGEYTILGTYHKIHNYWSWGNTTMLIDRTMSKKIVIERDSILNKLSTTGSTDEFKKFIIDNTTILPTVLIYEYMVYIDKLHADHNIMIKNNGDIMTFILMNNVFLDNL